MAQYPSRMYLIGSATPASDGWLLDTAPLMETVSEGVYEWVGNLKDGELKFLTHRDWMPSYGPATNGEALAIGSFNMTLRAEELADNDNKYQVTAGRYSLRIDLTGDQPQLTVADAADMEDKGFAVEYPAAVYAIGDATPNGWSLDQAQEMKETAFNSGVYKAQLTLKSGELKFLHQRDWGNAFGATVANAPVNGEGEYDMAIIGNTDDTDFKYAVSLAEETTYYITVDAVNSKLKLSLTDDSSTGIEQVAEGAAEAVIYDMQGRMMRTAPNELPAGIYIMHSAAGAQKIIIR